MNSNTGLTVLLAFIIIEFVFLEVRCHVEIQGTSASVRTLNGQLRGIQLISRGGRYYSAFMGIRYAVAKRFEAPIALTNSWSGIKDASRPGNPCPQMGWMGLGAYQGSEDCLFLNIYVPTVLRSSNDLNDFPVLVFIHGGHFSSGNGASYGPKYFMDEDVILITINYRLGVLGFLNTATADATGNFGLKDQVTALQWIKQHISAFGGDPKLVTVFGSDAGGVSVNLLLLSPMAQGLVHRAISVGGSALDPWAWQSSPRNNAKKLANVISCPANSSVAFLDCAQRRSAEEIVKAQSKFTEWFRDPLAPFAPSIETSVSDKESFLTEHPMKTLTSGNWNRVPWMAGVVENAGLLHHAYPILKDFRRLTEINNEWYKFAPKTLYYDFINSKELKNRISMALHRFYFHGRFIGQETRTNLSSMFTDRFYTRGLKMSALLHARFSPTWPFIFSYKGPYSSLQVDGYSENLGPTQGDELQYLFNSAMWPEIRNSEHERFSRNLVRLWVSFAREGYPVDTWGSASTWHPISSREVEGRNPVNWRILDDNFKDVAESFTDRMQVWSLVNARSLESVPLVGRPLRTVNNNVIIPTQVSFNYTGNPFSSVIQGAASVASQFLNLISQILIGISRPFQP